MLYYYQSLKQWETTNKFNTKPQILKPLKLLSRYAQSTIQRTFLYRPSSLTKLRNAQALVAQMQLYCRAIVSEDFAQDPDTVTVSDEGQTRSPRHRPTTLTDRPPCLIRWPISSVVAEYYTVAA